MTEQGSVETTEKSLSGSGSVVNTAQIVEDIASGKMSKDEAISALNNSRKRQFVRKVRTPYFRVTANGAVALYNVRRQPVVLYADQWDSLYSLQGEFQKYSSNEDAVKRRN